MTSERLENRNLTDAEPPCTTPEPQTEAITRDIAVASSRPDVKPSACGKSCARSSAVCDVLETGADDATVCFCYRLTTKMLKDAYSQYGSLKAVEEHTGAGTACTGCQVVLHQLFNEEPTDRFVLGRDPDIGTSCVKPGKRTMKGLIVATDEIESTVYSSNAVAPQLGSCDSSSSMEYFLLDHRGNLVTSGSKKVATNETFSFSTNSLTLPRPFYGLFFLTLDRSNFGAARFNVSWQTRGGGICSTHENATTGRPRFWLPIVYSEELLKGVTTIYLALTNPHPFPRPFTITVSNLDNPDVLTWASRLEPYATTWLNTNEDFVMQAVKQFGHGRWVMKVVTSDMDLHAAIAGYFFIRNERLGLWSCNHL